jgi:hypothetical protein
MPSLSGGSHDIGATGSTELSVPCSEMKAASYQAISYDKRIESLIASGLVCGIIPTSMRRQLGQQTLDSAFWLPDGDDAGSQRSGV